MHVLVIPKGKYVSLDDFESRAGRRRARGLHARPGAVARKFGVTETGFRAVSNNGPDGGQEVPHFHVHIVGGRKLGSFARRV